MSVRFATFGAGAIKGTGLKSARIDALLVSRRRSLLCAASLFGFSSALKIIGMLHQEAAPGVLALARS